MDSSLFPVEISKVKIYSLYLIYDSEFDVSDNKAILFVIVTGLSCLGYQNLLC